MVKAKAVSSLFHGSEALGDLPPRLRTPLPGERSAAWIESLAAHESPALTARRARRKERSGAPHDPIVWARAAGSNVIDADGNRFVDLTSGFGAAALGHAHPHIRAAVARQLETLPHALGDLHPSEVKIRALERIAALAPFPEARVILGLNGADALEAALKSARLATGRAGVLAFEGGYHGLSYGTLALCGYQEAFRRPFADQLAPQIAFAPYPASRAPLDAALAAVERRWEESPFAIGALVVEAVQGRGGVHIPPPGFLRGLQALCRARGALLIVDEIMTGLGRCGVRWQSVAEGVVPDLICSGKALGGELPLSACIAPLSILQAWGDPAGEALHTATFFGHPLGAAACLATLELLDDEAFYREVKARSQRWEAGLVSIAEKHSCVRELRVCGMMIGLELDSGERTLRLVRRLLERGFLVLPAGAGAEVLQLLPALNISEVLLEAFIEALDLSLSELSATPV